MKYEIEGLDKSKTIADVSVKNNYIDVKYKSLRHEHMDNTKDNIDYLNSMIGMTGLGFNVGTDWDNIIDSYEINKGYIEVKYLDGSIDLIENTEENMNTISKQMNKQAKLYVKYFKMKAYLLGFDMLKSKISIVLTLILFASFLVLSFTGYLTKYYIDIVFRIVSSIWLLDSIYETKRFLRVKKELEDLEKYKLFLEERDTKIKKFNDYYEKEKALKPSLQYTKGIKPLDIMNLDKITLKQLKEAIVKAERYSQLINKNIDEKTEEERIKVKTFKNRD